MKDFEREDMPSASKLSQVIACPGCINLSNSIPDKPVEKEEEDDLTKSGIRIHAALDTGNTLELSEEEERLYKLAVKYTKQAIDEWIKDSPLLVTEESVLETINEQRIWLFDDDLNRVASGQLDRLVIQKNASRCVVVDFKTGFTPNLEPAERNSQMRLCAVLTYREYDVNSVRCVLIKPRSKNNPIDRVDYTRSDLEFSYRHIISQLWLSRQPDAPRRAGNHCHYCPAKSECPEAAAYTMLPSVIARRASGSMPMESKEDAKLMVDTLAPADLLRIWEVSKPTAWIIDAVTARLKAMPESELSEIGLMLGKGRALDPITNVEGAINYLAAMGCSRLDVMATLSMSKEKVAALAKREKNLTSDKAASQWVAKSLAPFITPITASPSLRKI
jgi:hypothetical protein